MQKIPILTTVRFNSKKVNFFYSLLNHCAFTLMHIDYLFLVEMLHFLFVLFIVFFFFQGLGDDYYIKTDYFCHRKYCWIRFSHLDNQNYIHSQKERSNKFWQSSFRQFPCAWRMISIGRSAWIKLNMIMLVGHQAWLLCNVTSLCSTVSDRNHTPAE